MIRKLGALCPSFPLAQSLLTQKRPAQLAELEKTYHIFYAHPWHGSLRGSGATVSLSVSERVHG